MSLLTVVQDAMTLCGLPKPSNVFSNTNNTVEQFIAFLNVEADALISEYDWDKLISVETLTCAAGNVQTGYPATGFQRLVDKTDMWNATRQWPIEGPTSSGDWRELITRVTVTFPQYWRLIGGVLNIYAPVSGDSITFESVSNKWVYQAAGATLFSTLAGDTDTFIFSETLLKQGLIWRWKQSKQLDYAEDMNTYEITKAQKKKNDKGGTKTITTSRGPTMRSNRTWPGTVTP